MKLSTEYVPVAAKAGKKWGNDDQCALHQTGCGQNVHKGCEHGGHGGDDAAAEALLDFRRGSGAVVQIQQLGQCFVHVLGMGADDHLDRKSTRLNSSHRL